MSRRTARLPLLAFALSASTALIGCSGWPFFRPAPTSTPTPIVSAGKATPAQKAECRQLSDQIRDNEIRRRQAVVDTTSPMIRRAAQAKAERNIDDLRGRYAAMGCDLISRPPPRLPPNLPALPPAPGSG